LDILDPNVSGVGDLERSKQILRVVGNCCIGDEESQTLAVEHLDKLTRALEQDAIFEVAAGAVANLYSGDIASPDQAVETGLFELLATRFVATELDRPIITMKSPVVPAVTSFLSAIIEATLESGVLQPLVTKELLQALLHLPAEKTLDDEDAREESLGSALLLLKDETIQQKIVATHEKYNENPPPDGSGPRDGFDVDPWILTVLLYHKTTFWAAAAEEEEEAERLRASSNSLEAALCDIACLFKYPTLTRLENDFTLTMMLHWTGTRNLKKETNPSLQACAFLILGNIARRKDICETMVHKFGFHLDAIYLIKNVNESDSAIRHSAAGFLRNLANAKDNKIPIRESEVVRYLVEGETEAWADGFRLLRLVVRDEPEACAMLLSAERRPSPDFGVTMHSITQTLPQLGPGSPHENAECKIEIGRLLVASLKTVQQNQSTLGSYIFLNATLVGAILGLIQNAAGTPIASEGWLGLALASVNVEGAKLVYQALRAEDPPFNSLNKTFQSSVDAGDQMEILKDAENALVVVGQLVKNLVCCLLDSLYVVLSFFIFVANHCTRARTAFRLRIEYCCLRYLRKMLLRSLQPMVLGQLLLFRSGKGVPIGFICLGTFEGHYFQEVGKNLRLDQNPEG
jgi:hypothetical protein